MLFNSNRQKPRKRSYYPFSKNYPGKRGNSYDIGESRTRREKDERNNIIFYISLIFIFAAVFVVSSVAIRLSGRPIKSTVDTKAAEFNGAYKAVYMPDEALDGGIAYDLFRTELSNSDANAVVIDFKSNTGMLNYASADKTALKIGAAREEYSNAQKIINDLKTGNYKIIARIYCFEDRIAASMISGAGVREKGSNTVWLDESAQNNGNPWLNPYSSAATNYLISIVKESIDCGADMILLASVSFPSGSRLENAVFTTAEDAVPKNEILLKFIKKVKAVCEDTPVAVYMPADKALNGSKMLYDGSIIDSAADYNVIDFRTESLSDGFEFNGKVFTKENFSENSLIQTAIPALTDEESESYLNKTIIPIINDKIYISALENLGVSDYILIIE